MPKTKLEKLVEKYNNLQLEIELEIGSLPAQGVDMCKCERDLGEVSIVHQGNLFTEVFIYCVKCGGLIEHD